MLKTDRMLKTGRMLKTDRLTLISCEVKLNLWQMFDEIVQKKRVVFKRIEKNYVHISWKIVANRNKKKNRRMCLTNMFEKSIGKLMFHDIIKKIICYYNNTIYI